MKQGRPRSTGFPAMSFWRLGVVLCTPLPGLQSCYPGKHFNPARIQDNELRKRFDKNKTLKQNMEATNLKDMYKAGLQK